jgi:hypothetical protein
MKMLLIRQTNVSGLITAIIFMMIGLSACSNEPNHSDTDSVYLPPEPAMEVSQRDADPESSYAPENGPSYGYSSNNQTDIGSSRQMVNENQFQHQQNDSRQYDGSLNGNTESAGLFSGNSARVVIMDHGLNIPLGTYTLPEGWKISHSVAYDPNTGSQVRYQMEKYGPAGQLARGFPSIQYGEFFGRSFDDSWKQPVVQSLQRHLSDLSFGGIRHSERLQSSRHFSKFSMEAASSGMRMQALEIPFHGKYNGRDYSGIVFFINTTFPEIPGTGLLTYSLAISPSEIFQSTLDTIVRIEDGFQPNPRHQQAMAQIMQRNHQRNMAGNQASFNAHQQRMASQRQSFDTQNQQWSSDFFGSDWSTSSGNGYTSHESFIDGITDHTTFDDPYSGNQIRNEGNFKYNYTDGLGNYYGTDDPSFNASSLQGNWQPIEPVRPDP